MLEHNAEVDTTDIRGWTPPFYAARRGREAIELMLLDHNANPRFTAFDQAGNRTALHYAVMNGHAGIAKVLIERGAVVDAQDKIGRTPLMKVVSTELSESDVTTVMETLLYYGADINFSSDDEATALRLASHHHKDAVELLISQPEIKINSKEKTFGLTALSFAAAVGVRDIVHVLLKAPGIEVNSQDNTGRTALSWAAGQGHHMVVQLLLDHVDINASQEDDQGRTPAKLATSGGHQRIVSQIVAHLRKS